MRSTFELRSARLRVASLDRAGGFYAGVLGLAPGAAVANTLALHAPGQAEPLLTLVETPGAQPKPSGVPGLFHLALLVPGRAALGRVLLRLAEKNFPLQGLSDHGVSEAIYLEDPDGNGLEIYADRPRAAWPTAGGKTVLLTRPLNVDALLATIPDRQPAGLPAGTMLGHVHLRVQSLEAAEAFYTGELGLAVIVRDIPGALFFGADGYHHHVAANLWGRPANGSGGDYAGLDAFDAGVRDLKAPRTLVDPEGVRINLTPLTGSSESYRGSS
ncbi:MAG: VOC family protein [Verrucomicrobia bacterium]|nr:VOC family protein [Verrucomicrobiota bacterium]